MKKSENSQILLKSVIFLLFVFAVSSCTSVLFKSPQPNNGNSMFKFPVSLQGTYIDEEEDTLFVYETYTRYGNDNIEFTENNDTLIPGKLELRKLDNYYLLNFKDEVFWNVLVIKPIGSDFDALYIDLSQLGDENVSDNESEKIAVEKIKKYTKIVEANINESDSDYYLINPTPIELKKMLDNGIFVNMAHFKRI